MRLTGESRCTAIVVVLSRLGRSPPSRTWLPPCARRDLWPRRKNVYGRPYCCCRSCDQDAGAQHTFAPGRNTVFPLSCDTHNNNTLGYPEEHRAHDEHVSPRDQTISPNSQQCHVKVIRRNTKSFTLSLSAQTQHDLFVFAKPFSSDMPLFERGQKKNTRHLSTTITMTRWWRVTNRGKKK